MPVMAKRLRRKECNVVNDHEDNGRLGWVRKTLFCWSVPGGDGGAIVVAHEYLSRDCDSYSGGSFVEETRAATWGD